MAAEAGEKMKQDRIRQENLAEETTKIQQMKTIEKEKGVKDLINLDTELEPKTAECEAKMCEEKNTEGKEPTENNTEGGSATFPVEFNEDKVESELKNTSTRLAAGNLTDDTIVSKLK